MITMTCARARIAVWFLGTALLCACAERASRDDFAFFWQQFSGAVARDSEADVRALTRFPFLFESEERDSMAFGGVYAGLFDPTARECMARAQPVADGDTYQVACGPIIFVFGREADGWRFTEFTADPEAVEGAGPVGAEGQQPGGVWRIARGMAAPWVTPSTVEVDKGRIGERVEFAAGRVIGPQPLACNQAAYDFGVTPAEGLFQGNLPAPAARSARASGVARLPVMTLHVACGGGAFDYHYTAADVLLTALDNVVWRLETVTPPDGPHAVVQELLLEHMTGDMGFTPELVRPKRRLLSPELNALVNAYFARTMPENEPPPINGDPFTNSQEYPTGFRFGDVVSEDSSARVTVAFVHVGRTRPVTVLLRRVTGAWLIDDLIYEDGMTFRALLTPVARRPI
jgi:hypothetical protein